MDIDGASILARGITALGPAGPVFENVDASIPSGSLAVVTGPAGSGRTTLLLALSGRYPVVAGYLEVSDYRLPRRARAVRRLVRPARLSPGFELDESLRVRDLAAERRMVARLTREAIEDALEFVEIDPDPSTPVRDLHPTDRILLAIGLTYAEWPTGMVIDDVEAGLPFDDRERVWDTLRALTDTGMTVVASSTDPIADAEEIPLPAHEDMR